jgi:pSer/pThr/pTyr-binding forkhead associated (FHA) protein
MPRDPARLLVSQTMPAQLIALSEGPSIWLDKPILLIGRHPECDIQIDSRKISRRHCCIAQVSDYLLLRDLGSTNGVRINGVRVVEGRIAPGDEVTIGGNRYRVSWDSIAPEGPAALRMDNTARPQSPEEVDDERLESSDEPIPLTESGRPRLVNAPPPSKLNESLILPEKLELATGSDELPPR